MIYSLRSKILVVLALDFYVYIQIDDDESRYIITYIKHIRHVFYESTNYLTNFNLRRREYISSYIESLIGGPLTLMDYSANLGMIGP